MGWKVFHDLEMAEPFMCVTGAYLRFTSHTHGIPCPGFHCTVSGSVGNDKNENKTVVCSYVQQMRKRHLTGTGATHIHMYKALLHFASPALNPTTPSKQDTHPRGPVG